MTHYDTQNRIIMMQERASAEGVAIALNSGYSEDDLDVTAAELSFVISGWRE